MIRSRTYQRVSFWARIVTAVFLPMLFLPANPFIAEGYVTSYGICLLVNTAPKALLILFLIGMNLMTLVMMYLFVAPIHMSLAAVNPASAKSLKRTLYRNVIHNTIAMTVQTIYCTMFCILNPGRDSLWQDGADFTLSVVFSCTDCFQFGICARLMVGDRVSSTAKLSQ